MIPVLVGFLAFYLAWLVFWQGWMYRAVKLHLQDELRGQRHRNRMGELEHKLIVGVATGVLDDSSARTQLLWRVLRQLHQPAQEYGAVAQGFLSELDRPAQQGARAQSVEPPLPLEAALARELAQALDLLCKDYSRAYRWMAWLTDGIQSARPSVPLWLWMRLEESDEYRRVKPLKEAKERFESWAAPIAAV